jgi:hypothetical protein
MGEAIGGGVLVLRAGDGVRAAMMGLGQRDGHGRGWWVWVGLAVVGWRRVGRSWGWRGGARWGGVRWGGAGLRRRAVEHVRRSAVSIPRARGTYIHAKNTTMPA